MEKRYKALRFFAYSIEILIFYIIQGTPKFIPSIFGSKPCMLIPIAITIAVFESEIAAMIFGTVCGILTDIGYGNTIGYFAITLCIICFFIGFFYQNVIVTNLINTSIIGFITVVLVLGFHFVIFHISQGNPNPKEYFISHYISRILYTFALVPLFYYLNKLLSKGMRTME